MCGRCLVTSVTALCGESFLVDCQGPLSIKSSFVLEPLTFFFANSKLQNFVFINPFLSKLFLVMVFITAVRTLTNTADHLSLLFPYIPWLNFAAE